MNKAFKSKTKEFFLAMPKSEANILNFCVQEYEQKARQKGDLFASNYLETIARRVCKLLGISKIAREKILKRIPAIASAYRIRAGMHSKKAKIFHPDKHFELIKYLWTRQKTCIRQTYGGRLAAVQALICLHTFRRWVDISRIRWEHCDKIVVQGRIFYQFKLGASKTNSRGQRNEYITIQQNDTIWCPVKILHQFWKMSGCPRTGFVFPCINEQRSFTTNSLFQQWDAYTCPGHRSKEHGLHVCLGEINGVTSFGYYQRAAKKFKWQELPGRHSFRRLGVVIANKLNVPRERITEFFGWKHDSHMLSLYLQEELATTSQGLAWKFTDALETNLSCLNDISFAE